MSSNVVNNEPNKFHANLQTLLSIRDYLRNNKTQIQILVAHKDPESLSLEKAYRAWHADQYNPACIANLIHVAKQFVRRDLEVANRAILQNRYGYKVP